MEGSFGEEQKIHQPCTGTADVLANSKKEKAEKGAGTERLSAGDLFI